MQWPSLIRAPSQHRPPRQDRRAVHPQSLYIYRITSPASNSTSRSATASRVRDFPLQYPHGPEPPPPPGRLITGGPMRSPGPFDTTRRRYSNPSPSAWASRQCVQCLMPADARCSPLSPSSSPPTFRPSTRRYSQRVAGACPQRGALHCPRCATRSSPCLQNPPSHHASSLRSTNHYKRSPVSLEGLTLGLRRQRCGQRKRRRTELAQFVVLRCTRRCCGVSSWHAGAPAASDSWCLRRSRTWITSLQRAVPPCLAQRSWVPTPLRARWCS